MTERKKPNSVSLLGIILPGFYLAAALYFDYLCPLGLLAPFFVVVGLIVMAMVFRPALMIPWAAIYTALVCTLFLSPKLFTLFSGHSYYDQYVIPSIRAGTYVVVGIIACYLCVVLNRVKKSERELRKILENVSFPILTSNVYGQILYWNDSAKSLLPELGAVDGSNNYFDLLAPPEFRGRTISEYLKCFEYKDRKGNEPLRLRVKCDDYKGHVIVIDWTEDTILLTTLSKGEVDSVNPS